MYIKSPAPSHGDSLFQYSLQAHSVKRRNNILLAQSAHRSRYTVAVSQNGDYRTEKLATEQSGPRHGNCLLSVVSYATEIVSLIDQINEKNLTVYNIL